MENDLITLENKRFQKGILKVFAFYLLIIISCLLINYFSISSYKPISGIVIEKYKNHLVIEYEVLDKSFITIEQVPNNESQIGDKYEFYYNPKSPHITYNKNTLFSFSFFIILIIGFIFTISFGYICFLDKIL